MSVSRDVIVTKSLTKKFGDREILTGIDLTVGEGEALVLLGRSGAGKTTLLRCLNLLDAPTTGEISLNGKRIFGNGVKQTASDLVKLRRGLGMVFQHFGLFPHLTALENITMPLVRGAQLGPTEAIERALLSLADVGILERAFDLPSTLSGGQQQRVAIARALALQPTALLFDEPTSALDLETTGDLVRVLTRLKSMKMTMVIVTHDISFAMNVADRIAFMKDGAILSTGTPGELIHASEQPELTSFFSSIRNERMPTPA